MAVLHTFRAVSSITAIKVLLGEASREGRARRCDGYGRLAAWRLPALLLLLIYSSLKDTHHGRNHRKNRAGSNHERTVVLVDPATNFSFYIILLFTPEYYKLVVHFALPYPHAYVRRRQR